MTVADHKVLNDEQESRLHHRFAVVVQDLATRWSQSYPCKTISAQGRIGIMRDLHSADPKQTELQNVLYDE